MSRKHNDWQYWNVAVTGVSARPESPAPGCAVARCLRENDDFRGRIIGLGYDVLDSGLYARNFCDSGYLIPYPSAGEEALLERIRSIHAEERIDAIIPCLDAEMQTFISLRPELMKMGIKLFIPSRDQFQLRAKDHLAAFCKSIDVLVPETKTITDPLFFDTCHEEGWHFPLIIKGIFYDATVARDPLEAKAIFAKMVATWGYPVLVQKMISGDELNLAAVGDGKGNMLGEVMMRKRGLTDKGKAWAGVTVDDSELREVALRLIRGLTWRGPLEVEVMKSHEGKIYLIEINPRFPAWIYLSHAVGRNLPIAVLQLMSGESEFEFAEPEAGTFFIRYAQELIVDLAEYEAMFVHGGLTSGRPALRRAN